MPTLPNEPKLPMPVPVVHYNAKEFSCLFRHMTMLTKAAQEMGFIIVSDTFPDGVSIQVGSLRRTGELHNVETILRAEVFRVAAVTKFRLELQELERGIYEPTDILHEAVNKTMQHINYVSGIPMLKIDFDKDSPGLIVTLHYYVPGQEGDPDMLIVYRDA